MQYRRLGYAWLALTGALALHVVDEASTGFLSVYNPTVLDLRHRWSWFPMPTFEFGPWLGGLIFAVVVLFALSPLLFKGVRAIRPLAYFFAVMMILNALGHTAGTIAGRSVAGVRFARPMPGFWSSPLLLAASIWLLVELRRTARTSSLQMRAAQR